MFYARINKIKVFNEREGFHRLFNHAEMRIYGFVTGYFDSEYPATIVDVAPQRGTTTTKTINSVNPVNSDSDSGRGNQIMPITKITRKSQFRQIVKINGGTPKIRNRVGKII